MLCSKCHRELAENVRFCPHCGQTAPASANKPTSPTPARLLPCSKCGMALPTGSKFCLSCGQPVPPPSLEPPQAAKTAAEEGSVSFCDCGTRLPTGSRFCPACGKSLLGDRPSIIKPPRPRHTLRDVIVLLFLLGVLGGIAWWASNSESPAAKQIQTIFTKEHTQSISPGVFAVKAKGFSSYRFTVPTGAIDVSVSGEFGATGDSASDLEVFVFKEDAFVNWQYGYTPAAYYSSGKVRQADIQVDLPAGAGTYYLVFNNNFSPRITKAVQADVTLHYNKFWLPQF